MPKAWRLIATSMLLIVIMSWTFPKLLNQNRPKSIQNIAIDYQNISLCAPLNRFKIDIENAITPLAPTLKTNWTTSLKITTTSKKAQVFFNQGLFYLYSFNHAEAERAFKEGIRLDPNCAMCYWGVALALGPNINRPMPSEYFEDVYDFSQKALTVNKGITEKEKALIAALARRYVKMPSEAPAERIALDKIYATEMRIVSQQFREDLDIAILFAAALMNVMPWDYWHQDGTPKMETREVKAVLEYTLSKDTDHPGANHYFIHLVEAVHPKLAIAAADKLGALNLSSGHLVHMPSHIYVRVGRFHEAAIANQKAIVADEIYLAQCKSQGFYPATYYPHNLHFLWFVASMEGRSELAMETARKLITKLPKDKVTEIPFLERYYTIPLFSLIRFGRWDEILNEPKPADNLVYGNMIWQYARGMAYANKGKLWKAKKALKTVELAVESSALKYISNPRFPTIPIAKMAICLLKGEIAGQKKNFPQKVAHLQIAVAIQDGLSYDEPPFFHYPIRQALGAALLADNRPLEAAIIYREDLAFFPNNGWSLFGLHQSMIRQDRVEEATIVMANFEKNWKYADIKLNGSVK